MAQTASQKRKREARLRLIRKAKETTPCADCGQFFPAICMDFDHVRGTKVGNISAMTMMPLDRLEAEIAKCEIVCSNCYRLRSEERRLMALPSG